MKIHNVINSAAFNESAIHEALRDVQLPHKPFSETAVKAAILHIKEGVPFHQSIFRYGSDAYFETINVGRLLYRAGLMENVDWESVELFESDLGQRLNLKGIGAVYLDAPFMLEVQDQIEETSSSADIKQVGDTVKYSRGGKTYKSTITQVDHKHGEPRYQLSNAGFVYHSDLIEAEYQGKDVELNKPKRGGSKKFYVYTRNPKTGKVIKIQFGDPNLTVKSDDPDRAKNFAARHNCEKKTDRTKAGYWACRLPRYGLVKGGKWW